VDQQQPYRRASGLGRNAYAHTCIKFLITNETIVSSMMRAYRRQ
jgi:hypothetical protein